MDGVHAAALMLPFPAAQNSMSYGCRIRGPPYDLSDKQSSDTHQHPDDCRMEIGQDAHRCSDASIPRRTELYCLMDGCR
ncbi:hypothetical protein E2C01_065892 [Portunus trituberculatus]|uniref:Uncharacterized protein n=2 Tax=Portunus trituberculatus TaxID=210409 RepID=A0A5B7HSF2_PORTR|nr:hypothetical protein [Portunus trituberculatus]